MFERDDGDKLTALDSPSPNAVKDFCSENSDLCRETLPKSHDFGYEKLPFSSTKNP
ncbi:MAG TPA: hypothetical protein PLY87_01945 [Planctomycetaceae bacterium]|nr:hypothetical protein [Planctomycetaceae bacterium]